MLSDITTEYLLGSHLEMLRDPSGRLTIEEVTSPEVSLRFVQVAEKRPNLGYTSDAIWFRFTVVNNAKEMDWILNAGREWIEEVTLYTRDINGRWVGLTTGAKLPYLKRPVVNEHPVLPLTISPGTSREFYLRLMSKYTPLTLRMQLMTKDQFASDSAMEKLYIGGYYGVLVVMALYNIVLAYSLRNLLFAKLASILIFLAIAESGVHGHLSYILPSNPMAGHRISTVATALIGFSVTNFTMHMLKTRRYMPLHHTVLTIWMFCSLLTAIVAVLTTRAHEAVFWLSGVGSLITCSAGIRRYIDRDQDAAYFTVALLSWIIPVIFVMGAVVGLLPLYFLTDHGVHIGGIAMSILLSLGVAEQVNRVNRAALRFLPKPFLSRLGYASIADVKQGDSIEDEMTVLFSDIRNFTRRSEQMSPSDTFAFLNTYLEHVVPPIERHGGLIDKYIGDAVMALFPASSDSALKAAVEMQEAVQQMNDILLSGQEPIAIGIGLHRGRLMLGTVGDGNRLDVTVISDTVNVAARLESLTKDRDESIIISGSVVKSLQHPEQFALQELGTALIKGRTNVVELWGVRKVRAQAV